MMANYKKEVEPLTYVGKLIAGIFCTLLSINWILLFLIHGMTIILGADYAKYDYLNTFINRIDGQIVPGEQQTASFTKFLIIDAYFLITSIYLINCTVKGNDTYGYRFACFTFYPVTANETLCSSFLFNAVIKNIVTTSIMQACVLNIPSYTNGSEIYLMSNRVKYSYMTVNIAKL